MSEEQKFTDAMDALIGQVADGDSATVLVGLRIVAEAIDELRSENAALKDCVQQLLMNSLRPDGTASRETDVASVSERPPQFQSSFCDYERGELFADDVGFDWTLQFADQRSFDCYRMWSFVDAGHALHIILEACARMHLGNAAEELMYRRDIESLTIYAKNRTVLERLHASFTDATATYAGAMKLLENMNRDLKNL